jgi:hypothetical protein
MHRFHLKARLLCFIFSIIVYLLLTSVALATGITGTYTGPYSGKNGQTGGTDSGTITITIDPYGNVSCDFHSTVYGTDNTVIGSVNEDPTVFPPLMNSTVTCAGVSSVVTFGYPPFFAAVISFAWETGSEDILSGGQSGIWFNNTGYVGEFSLNTHASPNAATAPINVAGLTGLWYDPNYTGAGFNLTGSSLGLIVTYYGWDKSGNRLWLISSPESNPITFGQSMTFSLVQTVDGTFSTPALPSTATPWGTLTLTFSSCTAATATLSGADGNINESLVLLAGLNGLGCQ